VVVVAVETIIIRGIFVAINSYKRRIGVVQNPFLAKREC